MNALARPLPDEFVPRHRLTLDEVLRMVEVGVLRPNQPVELIDGALVEMASEGHLHVDAKTKLIRWLILNAPEDLTVVPDSTLHLPPDDAPEPDCYVYPSSVDLRDLRGSDVLLIVEVADSSLAYDVGFKPGLYGRFGVQEYWVLDLINGGVVVHQAPSIDGYASVRRFGTDEGVAVPGYLGRTLALRDLQIGF